jgi:hypothetical protein
MVRTSFFVAAAAVGLAIGGVPSAQAQTVGPISDTTILSTLCQVLPVCGLSGAQPDDGGVINSRN